MSLIRRDSGDVEALITDRYLDSLLAIQPTAGQDRGPLGEQLRGEGSVGAAVRAVSRRLATDLPRFHP